MSLPPEELASPIPPLPTFAPLSAPDTSPGPPGPLSASVDGVADWVTRYKELKAAEKHIAGMLDEARSTLLDWVARQYGDQLTGATDVEFTVKGEACLRRQWVQRRDVDVKRLRAELPSVAAEFTRVSIQERLTIL